MKIEEMKDKFNGDVNGKVFARIQSKIWKIVSEKVSSSVFEQGEKVKGDIWGNLPTRQFRKKLRLKIN